VDSMTLREQHEASSRKGLRLVAPCSATTWTGSSSCPGWCGSDPFAASASAPRHLEHRSSMGVAPTRSPHRWAQGLAASRPASTDDRCLPATTIWLLADPSGGVGEFMAAVAELGEGFRQPAEPLPYPPPPFGSAGQPMRLANRRQAAGVHASLEPQAQRRVAGGRSCLRRARNAGRNPSLARRSA